MQRVRGGRFLVLERAGLCLEHVEHVCSVYGVVTCVSADQDPLRFLSLEKNLTAMFAAWAPTCEWALDLLAHARNNLDVPVLVLCSDPTRALVQQVFHTGASISCLPVPEADLAVQARTLWSYVTRNLRG